MSDKNEEKSSIDIIWIIEVKLKIKKIDKYSNDRSNLLEILNYNQGN